MTSRSLGKFFVIFSRLWAKHFLTSVEKLTESLLKLFYNCSEKKEGTYFYCFFWYSDIEQKLVGFCQKEIRRICKNCLLRVHTIILLKNRFYGKFFFFRNLGNTFPCFRPTIYRKVVKAIFYMFRQHFVGTDFFEPFLFLVHNLTLSTNFLRFG